jgi:hypothetical protein
VVCEEGSDATENGPDSFFAGYFDAGILHSGTVPGSMSLHEYGGIALLVPITDG